MAYDPTIGKVILFGGYGPNGAKPPKYLQMSDTWAWSGSNWSKLPLATSPPGLQDASLAYDPVLHDLVLFGGYRSAGGPQEETWTFNGSKWSQVVPAASPPPRRGATMLYDTTSKSLVLAGGQSPTGTILSDTWGFNGATWSELCSGCAPAAYDASAAADPTTGELVLYAGVRGTWIWTGTTWQQSDLLNEAPPTRQGATLTYDGGTGQLVLFGGEASSATGGPPVAFDDTWTWEGSSWSDMSAFATPPQASGEAIACDQKTGQLVLFGGSTTTSTIAGDAWSFDGSAWSHFLGGPPAREGAAMAYDAGTGEIVLFGGQGAAGLLNDTWTYDGSKWSRRAATVSPAARSGAVFAYDPVIGGLVLFGGSDANGELTDTWVWNGYKWSERSSAASGLAGLPSPSMAFDGSSGQLVLFGHGGTWVFSGSSWSDVAPNSPPYGASSMAFDQASSQLVLFAGANSTGSYDSTWTWNGSSWTAVAQTKGSGPMPNGAASMAYDTRIGAIVMFGANGGLAAPSDTWEFDGGAWTEITPSNEPSTPVGAVTAYDDATGQLVSFGGTPTGGLGLSSDTWTFNGLLWTDHASSAAPPARDGASMAFDPSTRELILFGGENGNSNGNGALGDTWAWNGISWKQVSSPVSPTPRSDASMVYDHDLNAVLLFGGYGLETGGSTGYLSDTWAFNGTWTQVPTGTSPPARDLAAMSFGGNVGEVVLFGGSNGNSAESVLGDTWTFHGTTWTQQSPATSPAPRAGASMDYEATTLNEPVLFGGYGNAGNPNGTIYGDTWAWNGTTWTQLSPLVSPPARAGESLIYDAVLNELVLVGGSPGYPHAYDDTWAFPSNYALPTVNLAESSTKVAYGSENAETFTITLSSPYGFPAPPRGSVVIEDSVPGYPLLLCDVTTLAYTGFSLTGTCNLAPNELARGTKLVLAVTALYSGDPWNGSAGSVRAGSLTVT